MSYVDCEYLRATFDGFPLTCLRYDEVGSRSVLFDRSH